MAEPAPGPVLVLARLLGSGTTWEDPFVGRPWPLSHWPRVKPFVVRPITDLSGCTIRCFDASPATWTASGWHPERRRGAFLARVAPKVGSAHNSGLAWLLEARGRGGNASFAAFPSLRSGPRRRQSWLISLGNAPYFGREDFAFHNPQFPGVRQHFHTLPRFVIPKPIFRLRRKSVVPQVHMANRAIVLRSRMYLVLFGNVGRIW